MGLEDLLLAGGAIVVLGLFLYYLKLVDVWKYWRPDPNSYKAKQKKKKNRR